MNKIIESRLAISRQLYDGKCGGSYSDAVLILVSIISAIAATVWPGKYKDRKRFIEILISETAEELAPGKISIPLILQDLEKVDPNNYNILKEHTSRFYGSTRVFEGKEIDKIEDEILEICPLLTKKYIRSFSYASILYSDVRSGLVHEYEISKNAEAKPMHDYCKSVSYANNAQLVPFNLYHSIHFHYEWIEQIVLTLQNNMINKWEKLPFEEPDEWWADGK